MKKRVKRNEVVELSHAEKTVLIDMLQEQILLLKEKNKNLEQKFKQLEGRLGKNSSNSNKPPSSDTKKPKKTTSSRRRTGKKPGGQPGHKGNHLAMSKKPDEIITLAVSECKHCGKDLKQTKSSIEYRQEFEIPRPKMWVTEYQAESKGCNCGYTTTACFPKRVSHTTQYGVRAKALMVYMNQYQLLPYDRASQFFETVYNHRVSPATIVNAGNRLSSRLNKLDTQIKDMLTNVNLAHCDETSMRVNGTKQWLHTVGTEKLTHYALHEKRGRQATLDIGILPGFTGTMVHDHWKSYFLYEDSEHALCNAHHIRELRFINEHHNMKWAKKISDLLIKIKEHKEKHIKEGKNSFSKYLLKKYNSKYDEILSKAGKEQAKKGTKDSHNLLKRLVEYKQETLLFMHDFKVPFTNNLSEQDLRMSKVKQKISGCFRNVEGGYNFYKIRSMLVSAKKNSKNIFDVLEKSFRKIISIDEILVT